MRLLYKKIDEFIILVFLGVAQNIQDTFSSTLIQNNIPKDYIGRVFALYKILLTLFAFLGLLIAGLLYNLIDVGNYFLSVSVILIILNTVKLKHWLSKECSSNANTII